MAENSSIEWCHHTMNTHWGCAKVSPACDNCYAERDAHRYFPSKTYWGVDAERREFGDNHWNEPLRWNRRAAAKGVRERVFVNSMADTFDKNAPAGARERLWGVIAACPNLDFLLLTKRIGNAPKMVPISWMEGGWPANAWPGSSVVTQEEVDRDLPKLLSLPARIRFLSCEPMLEPLDLSYWLPGIQWVIGGGESGPNARPVYPEWAQSLRDQCAAAGVAFLWKQWGEWKPLAQMPVSEKIATDKRYLLDDTWLRPNGQTHTVARDDHEAWGAGDVIVRRVGKKAAGRLLDGIQHDGYPL